MNVGLRSRGGGSRSRTLLRLPTRPSHGATRRTQDIYASEVSIEIDAVEMPGQSNPHVHDKKHDRDTPTHAQNVSPDTVAHERYEGGRKSRCTPAPGTDGATIECGEEDGRH